jgi:excisionase family DNA binding protein
MLADAIVDLAATMPPATHPVELVAVDAAAKRLGIARSTLYQIIGTGAIRSVQVGGRRFVPSSEIEAVAEGRQNGPASQRGRPKAGKGGPHA